MKKTFQIFIILLLVLFNFNSLRAQDENKTVYFYAVGWEYRPYDVNTKSQPVVSNVVKITCNGYIYNSSLGVDNQFNDYYTAYHGKDRNCRGLDRMIAFGFDTWDEAESHRLKAIADYNYKWNPLLIQNFRYLCKE